jgi:hypothetical protein
MWDCEGFNARGMQVWEIQGREAACCTHHGLLGWLCGLLHRHPLDARAALAALLQRLKGFGEPDALRAVVDRAAQVALLQMPEMHGAASLLAISASLAEQS